MAELVNTIVLPGHPFRISTVLIDPEQRRQWYPDDQRSASCPKVSFINRLALKGLYGLDAQFRNLEADYGSFLLARFGGIRGLLSFQESFEINGDDGGTCVIHTIKFSGVFSCLLGEVMLRDCKDAMLCRDDRLVDYLRFDGSPTSSIHQHIADCRTVSKIHR